MSYTDNFGGTGEAYAKLPLFEAHKKIADGEISPEEASALAIVGALKCLNATFEQGMLTKKINVIEKYLVIKGNSTTGLEKEDIAFLIEFARAVTGSIEDEILGKEGEIGDFNRKAKDIVGAIVNETENLKKAKQGRVFLEKYESEYSAELTALHNEALLVQGHAEALEAIEPQITALYDGENETLINTVKKVLVIYTNLLKDYAASVIKTWNFIDTLKDIADGREATKSAGNTTAVKKENPDKKMLDNRNPQEIKAEVEENKYSSERRKILTECIKNNFSDADADCFEKLVWLDESGKTAAKRLPDMKSFYGCAKLVGWSGTYVNKLAGELENAPRVPSRNFLWDIIAIIVFVALAALVAFHPSVALFFDGASTGVLAIITIVAFIVGAICGGPVVGVVVAFLWIVLSYFLNKIMPIEKLFQIISAIILLIPAIIACGDISTRSKKAIDEAKSQKKSYCEKLLKKCENMQDYLNALVEKISSLDAESEDIKTAVNYYNKLKSDVTKTINGIRKCIDSE